MCANEFNERITLFEGIIIGIYGNWIISLLDKITYSKDVGLWGILYQPYCIFISLICFIILFIYTTFRPNSLPKRFIVLLSFGHIIGYYAALSVEGLDIKTIVFYLIGFSLFLIILICELSKIKSTMFRCVDITEEPVE